VTGPRSERGVTGSLGALARAAAAVLVAAAVVLAAASAAAQSTSQQTGRPQPPPAPKPAAQPAASEPAAQPQGSGTKPAAAQPAKPASGGTQAKGAKAPPPKKPAPPRTSKVWKGRGFAVVNGGVQAAGPGYTSTAVFKVHAEDATLNAEASVGVGPAFGARGGVRVWKNMAVGGGLEIVSSSQTLDVTGRLPHPFQFNQYREVSGTASGLERVETLVAFEVSWLFAVARRVDMFVFGGPAYINVRQDMATRIRFTESYPYDSASFAGVDTVSVSGGGLGATLGADVSYLMTKHLALGGEARYSYASTTLTPAGQPAKVGLGGLQVAFGARILF
jgi:hypothetical protein